MGRSLISAVGAYTLRSPLDSPRRGPMPLSYVAMIVFLAPAVVKAEGEDYVRANYTKFEYRIPMRDGKRLFTAVYVPKDDSQKYPILMTRTPYTVRPYGAD